MPHQARFDAALHHIMVRGGAIRKMFFLLEPVLPQHLEILDIVYRIETEPVKRWNKTPYSLITAFVQCNCRSLSKAFVQRAGRHILAFQNDGHVSEACEIAGETLAVTGCFYCWMYRLINSIRPQARVIRCSERSRSAEHDEKKRR